MANQAPPSASPLLVEHDVAVPVRDGIQLRVDVYRPPGEGPFPVLFAASPYGKRFVHLPATPVFRFRETGHIQWFVERGYAYVLLDVRGTGSSRQGTWAVLDQHEQNDLYDVIEWIAAQPWSTGKVGMIGESYFGASQWLAAAAQPPHLACIAPYDAFVDPYREAVFHGGIACVGFASWWSFDTRARTLLDQPTMMPDDGMSFDLIAAMMRHPTEDEFWLERSAERKFHLIHTPFFSIGNWKMVGLHTRGNLLAFEQINAPKKLLMNAGAEGGNGTDDSQRIFDSLEFHEVLLRFYDHWLKGVDNGVMDEPAVQYVLQGKEGLETAETWPLPDTALERYYLAPGPAEATDSINDGALESEAPPAGTPPTKVSYPDPAWSGWPGLGTGVFGTAGLPNAVKRILTFSSPELDEDLEVVGPIELRLFLSSDQTDTDVLVRLSDQPPMNVVKSFVTTSLADVGQPARVVTRGWLKASHRALDPHKSKLLRPWHTHRDPKPLVPGQVYELAIELWPTAWLFKKGHRIRLELSQGDSPIFDAPFNHHYGTKMGTDTIHHEQHFPSVLLLPVRKKK